MIPVVERSLTIGDAKDGIRAADGRYRLAVKWSFSLVRIPEPLSSSGQ